MKGLGGKKIGCFQKRKNVVGSQPRTNLRNLSRQFYQHFFVEKKEFSRICGGKAYVAHGPL